MQEGHQHVTAGTGSTPVKLTRTHRILISIVVAGAAIIAAIGFAGSYAAVRELALQKGFGNFSLVFPIGIDAGICVLLALDLLLTWLRIPFPLLRQTAWLLTAATIAFNGAAAWPDPLGVGMHAVIPVLFVVSVEAARHAVGRIADITADKHMEGVRLTRWLLSPVPTFRLWRRMKLWELRSYEQVIKLEQDRLIYQARLQARFGRNWRRKAPVESLMPLRLAKYGVPLAETGPAGLAAAGIEPALLPPTPALAAVETAYLQAELVGEHQRALDVGEMGAAATPHAESMPSPSSAGAETLVMDEPVHPDIDFSEAIQGYVTQFGELPNARQLGLFLAHYGVVDPVTGSVLTEGQLRPILQDFKMQIPQLPVPADEQEGLAGEVTLTPVEGDGTEGRGAGADAPADRHSFSSTALAEASAGSQLDAIDPVLVSAASAAGDLGTGGGVPQQPALNVPSARTAEASFSEPAVWEASDTDPGAATARLPEQQTDEPDVDPVQQQIVTVARWLAEAEEAGQRLSGAEVARRLGLSPKTGQRRVNAAAEYLEEQRRQQGRAHLRSVSS
ncbi:DUF2637 domain-containing protein [Streptomyces atratus]|uniref:DUF2637 domain-containing protein n=1 Tax=Streptomyces atratus TaxID=1893 RepID=UPI00224F25C3|nr:DUF2637 domain-containing protein [Streptomyces atratus]MCX5345855.1 DUF2637 domain-containing protein [Streptomyces atratus]